MKKLTMSGILILLLMGSCKDVQQVSLASFSVRNQPILSNDLAKKLPVKNLNDGEFAFSEALIGFRDIVLDRSQEGEVEREILFKGTYTFDVLNGMSEPESGPITIEAGRYHRLKVTLSNVLEKGQSIFVKGVYQGDNQEFDFEFKSDLTTELLIENELGIEIGFDERVNFVLVMPLEELFKEVDFSKLDIDNDNVIRINTWSNRDLKAVLEHKLLKIARLGKED